MYAVEWKPNKVKFFDQIIFRYTPSFFINTPNTKKPQSNFDAKSKRSSPSGKKLTERVDELLVLFSVTIHRFLS